MSKNLEKERTKVNNKRKKGVSLIALVITIIVIIILATIAFFASIGTVEKANYAKFATNISEVQSAIRQKALTLKGDEASKGNQLTDGQIYNYVAKGGKTDSDYVTENKLTGYTIIENDADIGIDLPTMKVNTEEKTGVKIVYAVTDDGNVFVWPPYGYEEGYYITDSSTITKDKIIKSGDSEVVIAKKPTTITTDKDGNLINRIPLNGDNSGEDKPATKIKLTKPKITGSYVYNGNTQTVTLSVFDSNTMAVSGNTRKDAGSQAVTVSLKDTSKYEWSDGTTSAVVLNWTVAKKSVSVSWSNLNFEHDGKNHIPTASVSGIYEGNNVALNITGAASAEGEHTATATLTGSSAENYELTNTTTKFTIVKTTVNVSTLTITLSGTSFTYTGAEIKPTVTIKNGATTLSAGTDYTLSYGNNKNAGTATITIKGNGKYVGTTTKNFTIERAKTAVATTSNKLYTGSVQIGVTGTNVDLSGTTSAINVGTYTATATPKANYAWSDGTTTAKTLTWKITEKASSSLTVNLATTTYTYDGTAKEPAVTVKDGSTTLTSGTHYTVSYTNNTNAGTATVTITMKGNYSGTITKNFTIERAKTASATVSDKTYNGSAQIGVTGRNIDLSGTTSATNVGTYTATATPKANYAWSDGTTTAKTLTWNMAKKQISAEWGSEIVFIYDGKEHAPTATATGATGETINVKVTGAQIDASGTAYTATASIESVTGGGANANNYTLTQTTKEFTISTKLVSVVWTNTSIEYTGGELVPTATAKSGVDGETLSLGVTGAKKLPGTYTATASIASVEGGQAKASNYNLINTSTEFKITKHLKVGDYVNYVPTSKTITTDTSKTGYDSAQTLTTQANTQWRILSIDETTGEVLLTTQGATNTDTKVTLKGATGYLHGAEELNRICKELYSNTEKGITAKSMTIEDLDKAVGYDPTTYSDYGKELTYTSGRFYTYEENGKTVTSETPKVASSSNPVTVKNTYYDYNPSSKNSTVGNILGNAYGWLASPCVYANSSNPSFRVHFAGSSNVYGSYLYDSYGSVGAPSYGVHPVVSLSSKYLLNLDETGKDGLTADTAWNIIGVDITGEEKTESTLTLDTSKIPSSYKITSKQWYSSDTQSIEGGTAIENATGDTYKVGLSMAKKYIYVVVKATAPNGTEVELKTITQNAITGLSVGDYVNYVPTSKTITTDTSKTGYDTAQTLTTQANTQWRILSIDETTGEILLTTQGATNTDTKVTLEGATGYLHGAEELNRICKELYSSGSLTARSMMVEDINKAVGYDPTTYNNYGKEYTYTSGTFYTYEENGKTVTSETPKVASSSNSVTVKMRYYTYDPSGQNPIVANMLESSRGWLASPCVNADSSAAYFVMRNAGSGNVNGNDMYRSYGNTGAPTYGLRPVISLSSKDMLNLDETGKDGLTADTAWNIIGVDITGEEKTESTLTLDASKIPSTYKVISKQWYSSDTQSLEGGTAIENAAGDTYKVELSMAKKYIYVVVKATAPNGTEVELKTITQNAITGLSVGDYVNYVPTSKTITTDTSKTGYDTAQTLTTQANTQWRILSIDETTGEILLTTQGATNTDTKVTLEGATGYLHGAEELNRICKELYSSGSLTARSMTIEDLNKAVGYDPTSNINYGKEYTYTSGRFYTYEENGKTVTSETPKVASSSNSVTVKMRYYTYDPSGQNLIVANMLESSRGWLASPCVNADSSAAYFVMRNAGSGNVNGNDMYRSYGNTGAPTYGLRPVISLSSKDMLNLDETGKDGLTADTAWNIIGVDITGEEKTESTLTLDTSKIPSSYKITSKQWYSSDTQSIEGGTAIENATGDMYKVELSMAKKYIYVVVKATAPNGTEVELRTITQNYIAGLAVGDYVNYVPTSKTITTDTSKTGYTSSQTLTTQANTQWRILSIDETTGEILLTTQGATNTDTNVTLGGAIGYLHGAEELNRICKELYSNTEKGITSKSMTIEDLNKAVGYDPTTYNNYGKEYTYTSGTFYTYEENGKTVTSETPKVASSSNPVTVKYTLYSYNPSSNNSTVGNILGSRYGWLASPYVYLDSEDAYAYYGLNTACAAYVGDLSSVLLAGYVNAPSCGLRPVISVNRSLLKLNDESKDGLTTDTAWELSDLKIGDYVNYVPTSKTITTDTSKTGYDTAQTLTTQSDTKWRVFNIDWSTGEILLTTQGATNVGSVTLQGATGYLHGAEELNRICKELYSNTEKGITARSMTIEDLNKAVGYDPTSDSNYGKEYTYTSGKFYTYEENGKTVTSEIPKVASSSNPVTVKETYYEYDPSSKNSTVADILGSSYAWLASPCVYAYSSDARFDMRYAYSSYVVGHCLYGSNGDVYTSSYGVRPVVSLSSKDMLNLEETGKDGLTADTAWNIIGVDITGEEKVGNTLTANISLPADYTVISKQWYSNDSRKTTGGTAIANATKNTYLLTSNEANKYIYVVVTAQKADGTTKQFTAITTESVKNLEITVTLGTTTYVYDGTAKEPVITVKDGSTTLTSGTHYTVSYSNNTNAGTATVTITMKGNYSGTITKNFTIERAKTASATASDKTYNGSAQIGVTGTNVDLSGTTSATNVGTYTATATPKANYAWSDGTTTAKTLTWKTIAKTLTVTPTSGQGKAYGTSDNVLTYTYEGQVSGQTPAFEGALARQTGEYPADYIINKGTLALKDNGTFLAKNYTLVLSSTTVYFTIFVPDTYL